MIDTATRQFFVKYGISPCRILCAVSGGGDSTALLLTMADLRDDGFEVLCAHVNHHLRGAESDGDEAFVRELSAHVGVPLHVADGTLPAEAVRAHGIEGAAREVRYRLLSDLRRATGAAFVATAHQADDQAETILMRLLTGSGLAGLRGIHPIRDDGFVRPLLDVTRAQIDAFLRARGVTPRGDSSNADPRFLRNRVRAFLADLGGVEHLAAVAGQARELWPLVEQAVDAEEAHHCTLLPDATEFRGAPEQAWMLQALLHRHIRRLEPRSREVSARDLARLAAEWPSLRRVSVTGELELLRRRDVMVLRRRPAASRPFELELRPGERLFIPALGRTIGLESNPRSAPAGAQQFRLPAGSDPRFLVRSRRAGDRFQPLGMAMSKRLKDFLIDRKIPAEARDSLPLLLWQEQIVWVAGVEIAEPFKVTTAAGGETYAVWLEGD